MGRPTNEGMIDGARRVLAEVGEVTRGAAATVELVDGCDVGLARARFFAGRSRTVELSVVVASAPSRVASVLARRPSPNAVWVPATLDEVPLALAARLDDAIQEYRAAGLRPHAPAFELSEERVLRCEYVTAEGARAAWLGTAPLRILAFDDRSHRDARGGLRFVAAPRRSLAGRPVVMGAAALAVVAALYAAGMTIASVFSR